MDLSIPILVSLGSLGFFLNKNKKNTENKLNDNLLGREKPSSKSTFNSNFVKESELKEKELSTLNYLKSMKPTITNVIDSNVYPLDCNDSKNYCNDSYNVYEEKEELLNGPLFNQKNDYLFSSKIEQFDENGNQISQLTGKPMEMTHNNMVPYTTIKGDSRGYDNNNIYQTKLDKFTGNDKTTQPKNIKPFAQPSVNRMPNMPNFTQLVDRSRFDTSKLISGIIPFEQITVGKIPQQLIQTKPRNVDELRSKNSPKIVYEGRNNHGRKDQVPMNDIGIYEQKGRGKHLRSYEPNIKNSIVGGFYKKGYSTNELTQIQEPKCKNVNEKNMGNPNKNNASYFGISELWNAITGYKKDSLDTQDSKNAIRNAKMGRYSQTSNENNLNNTYIKDQERDTTIQNRYTAPVGKHNFAPSNRNRDPTEPKTTNKEMNLHEYSGIASAPISAPIHYKSLKNSMNIVEKPLFENYTPNGLSAHTSSVSQLGLVETINQPNKDYYFGNGKMESLNQTNINTFGNFSLNNNKQMTDMGQRYTWMKPQSKMNLKK